MPKYDENISKCLIIKSVELFLRLEINMKIKDYFKNINNRVKQMDSKAQNPFTHYDYSYNPFKSAFKQTYIWIEKERKKNESN